MTNYNERLDEPTTADDWMHLIDEVLYGEHKQPYSTGDAIFTLMLRFSKSREIAARESTRKLYESELDMHRKFMESVIVNNQLKTSVMYCNKCGKELFNLKEANQ